MSVRTRLNVLRGYPPFDSNALTLSAVPNAIGNIQSGMLISLDANLLFVAGCPEGRQPFWAVQDQSAPDVLAAGKLTGLVGLPGFEIETPYFDTGTYLPGALLQNGTTPGNVAEGATPGVNDIIGIVSRGKYANKDSNSVVSFWTFRQIVHTS